MSDMSDMAVMVNTPCAVFVENDVRKEKRNEQEPNDKV